MATNSPLKFPKSEGIDAQPDHKRKRSSKALRTTHACEACKKRKTKCTGGPPPCGLCRTLATECNIDPSLDMRHKTAIQRTLDESRYINDTFTEFLESIRHDNLDQIRSMLDFIRSRDSLEEARIALHEYLRVRHETATDERSASEEQTVLPHGYGDILSPTTCSTSPLSPTARFANGTSFTDQGFADSRSRRPTVTMADIVTHLPSTSADEDIVNQLDSFRSPLFGPPSTFHGDASGSESSHSSLGHIEEERKGWHPSLQPRLFTNESGRAPFAQRTERSPKHPWSHPTRVALPPRRQRMVDLSSHVEVRIFNPSKIHIDGEITRQKQGFSNFAIPIHLIQPLSRLDDSPISRVCTDFLQAARHIVEQGESPATILANENDIVVDLFFRERRPGDSFTCCSWASEVGRNIPGFSELTRLATVLLLCHLMRWLVVPSADHYRSMPVMIRPTPAQRLIPHIAGIDTCPIPAIRDALIKNLRDWVTALAQADCSVNWPYGIEEALEKNPETNETRLTKAFSDHVVKYNNWTVTSRILETFPEIAGLIRIVEPSGDQMTDEHH